MELLQKLQYVILQQQEELALGLFNRCKALTIQNTSRDSDGLFFQHMERPSRDAALRKRQKQKKNVTAVARLLQPTMAL